MAPRGVGRGPPAGRVSRRPEGPRCVWALLTPRIRDHRLLPLLSETPCSHANCVPHPWCGLKLAGRLICMTKSSLPGTLTPNSVGGGRRKRVPAGNVHFPSRGLRVAHAPNICTTLHPTLLSARVVEGDIRSLRFMVLFTGPAVSSEACAHLSFVSKSSVLADRAPEGAWPVSPLHRAGWV